MYDTLKYYILGITYQMVKHAFDQFCILVNQQQMISSISFMTGLAGYT